MSISLEPEHPVPMSVDDCEDRLAGQRKRPSGSPSCGPPDRVYVQVQGALEWVISPSRMTR